MRYDLEYYENLLRRYSKTAEQICQIRWDWISEFDTNTVLDYGSGVGWFRAYRPKNVIVHTYDIGPFAQTGILRDEYDMVVFWDVLEHLSNIFDIVHILSKAKYIAGTVPVIQPGQEAVAWKHWKPGEHLVTWKETDWRATLWHLGWKVIKHGAPECPPREDIWSFVCDRNGHGT